MADRMELPRQRRHQVRPRIPQWMKDSGYHWGRAGQLRRKVAGWMLDRQGQHIPIGVAVSWLLFLYPLKVAPEVLTGAWIAAALVFVGFIIYELSEDRVINDEAYRDIEGFTVGLGAGAAAQALLLAFVGRIGEW